MSVRGDLRLAQLQAMRTTAPSDLEAFATSLEAACQRVLPHLTGEPALDIVRIAVFRGDGETGSDCELEGYAEEGTRRLWCAFDRRADNIEVYIIEAAYDGAVSRHPGFKPPW